MAINNVGMLYLNGWGVQRDIKLARSWFERAVTLGNSEAQENLKHLDEAGLTDGTQIAARRASCVQTCATLQKSYVNSVCDRFSAIADSGKPERTRCIDMSLTLAIQCRNLCREWAPTSVADNKCVTCFQALIACSISQGLPDDQDNDKTYAAYSESCLDAFDDCTANCRSGMPNANKE